MLAMSVPPGYGYGPLATRADASVLLSSLGFMELEVVDTYTRRRGLMRTFRAKRVEDLEIVQGCCNAGHGVVDAHSMLQIKRWRKILSMQALASERKIMYHACSWDDR